jgi:hypothetical protein
MEKPLAGAAWNGSRMRAASFQVYTTGRLPKIYPDPQALMKMTEYPEWQKIL